MNRKLRYIGAVTALLVGAQLADAHAVSAPSSPAPEVEAVISPSFHNMVTKGGTVQSGSVKVVNKKSGEFAANLVTPMFTTGWNVAHINNCLGVVSEGAWWLYAIMDSGDVFFTNIPAAQATLSAQCSTGNYTGFYVVDSRGTWTQLHTWYFK